MGEGMGPSLKHVETGNLHINGAPIDLIREAVVPSVIDYETTPTDNLVAVDLALFPRDEIFLRTELGNISLGSKRSRSSDAGVLTDALKKIIAAGNRVSSGEGIDRENTDDGYRLGSREIYFKKLGPLLFGFSKTEKFDNGKNAISFSLGRFGLNKVLGIPKDTK